MSALSAKYATAFRIWAKESLSSPMTGVMTALEVFMSAQTEMKLLGPYQAAKRLTVRPMLEQLVQNGQTFGVSDRYLHSKEMRFLSVYVAL